MSDETVPEMPRADVDELLGAYALDALDPVEREIVERHLAADPAARAEVDELREAAAALASFPAGEEGAPEGLWDRIAGTIGRPGSASDERTEPTVVPFAKPKRSGFVPARIAIPVAAAAALIIAILGVQVATEGPNRVGDVAAAYDHAVANGATTVQLKSSSGSATAAEIAVLSDGTGYLRNEHLAALPAGKTYQLWAVVKRNKGTRAISAGVLGRDPTAVAFHVATTPDTFAITVESAPGVVRSKNDPVASGSLGVDTAT